MSERTDLYRHFDKDDNLLYVGLSFGAIARLQQHKALSHWFEDIAKITIEKFPSRAKASKEERIAIIEEMPLHNIQNSERPNKMSRPKKKVKTQYDGMTKEELERDNFFVDQILADLPQSIYDNKALTRQQVIDRIEDKTGVKLTRGKLKTRFGKK